MQVSLVNPIPAIIADPVELGEFFTKYSIIPYYGTAESTSHYTLSLLSDLSTLSSSHKSCKINISKYAFSSKVDIVKQSIPGLLEDDESDDLSRADKIKFHNDFLNVYGIKLPSIVELSKSLYNDNADCGNAYLRIRVVKVGGTTQVFFKVLHYKQIAYLRTKKNEDRILIYTKKWGDEQYWAKNPPTLYKASYLNEPFNWWKRSNVIETVLHLKNRCDESDYYGRPDILSVMYWMFTEWCQQDLSVKTSSTEFVSKILLAFEEEDPARGKKGTSKTSKADKFRKRMITIRSLTTNEGNYDEAKTVGGIEYPFGSKPPIAIKLDINRDVKYSEFQINKASSYIYSIHGWDKQLSGFEPARSNIGGNIIIDLFVQRNIGTIMPLQDKFSDLWSNVFNEVALVVGYNGDVHTVKYANLIDSLVDKLIASKDGKTDDILKSEETLVVEDVKDSVDDLDERMNNQEALLVQILERFEKIENDHNT